jgi:60 kDa SS-A/Ro ribonucleoprotein
MIMQGRQTEKACLQATSRPDILNIGGFSDSVFDLIAGFSAGADGTAHWLREIQLQPLNPKMKIA